MVHFTEHKEAMASEAEVAPPADAAAATDHTGDDEIELLQMETTRVPLSRQLYDFANVFKVRQGRWPRWHLAMSCDAACILPLFLTTNNRCLSLFPLSLPGLALRAIQGLYRRQLPLHAGMLVKE